MGVVKTWNGIARASVKTFDGIAVASVKTINGYDATTGGGASYTLQETFGADSSDSPNIADSGVRKYVTGKCTPSSSYTLTRYELRMKRNGAGTAPDLVGKLYGDNGSGTAPNSLLATSTNTIASADVAATQGWIAFDFSGVALSSGTVYWLGVEAASTDGTNNYTARSGAFNGGNTVSSADASTWNTAGSRPWYIRTYVSP